MRFPKTGGILLCFLILSIILLAPIGTVNATQTASAVVWGSESTGAGTYPNSWRKHQPEIDLQRYITNIIRDHFAYNGYDCDNHQGDPGSLKANILSDIENLQSTYDRVAVVDFDHGIGRSDYNELNEWHYMFEDNVGTLTGPPPGTPHPENGVYDMDIFPLTASREVVFAFINTCLSANISDWQVGPDGTWWYSAQGLVDGVRACGLPFAWTHRIVKDKEDPNFNVLLHMSDDGYNTSTADDGPHCYIGFPWGSASLEQRIPYDYGGQYFHWVNTFFWYALNTDLSVNEALDAASSQHYEGANFGNCPLQTGFRAYWWPTAWPQEDSTMVVYGNGNIHLQQPTQYSLSISAGYGGTTIPSPGTYWYDSGTPVEVTADPDDGYEFSYWLLDQNPYYQNPITVTMNGNHDLQAYYEVSDFFVDNFNDNYMDPSKWEKLEVNGGTANETTGQLAVTVPSGTGVAQAGYVTKNYYDVTDCKATITVSEFDSLDEMTLQIGNTKTTDGDPYFEDNWYRILKARYDSKIYVQTKINGVLSTKVATTWTGATGDLTIDICDGSIAFYENGNMRYSEPYALPSYNCYIYLFTSTDKSRASGTDKFDNFALAPTPSFYDDFDDGNYNGWTVGWGGWNVVGGKLVTTQVHSQISTNSVFQSDRHVEAQIRTVTPGAENWQVAWLISKWVDWDNQLYVLLKQNGYVELGIRYGGDQKGWETLTDKDPCNTHTIAISTIDDRALVWIDGELYLGITDDWIEIFAGQVALHASMSTAEFDNVVVLD